MIKSANYNSMMGKRGDLSKADYEAYAEKILSWPVSEEKKQKLLDKLYEKWSEILKYEAQHVSVAIAGPARYNSQKLDKSDKILELSAAFSNWFRDLEGQIKQSQKKNSKAEELLEMIEFCRKSDNSCNPTCYLRALARHDNQMFIQLYEELYPEYKEMECLRVLTETEYKEEFFVYVDKRIRMVETR